MRAIALLAGLATAAAAAAEPPKRTVKLPDHVKEAADNAKLAKPSGVLGIDGQVASGLVIAPRPHPDAETVDQGGSIIVPPDPNDPMALELGTRQLRARAKIEPWLPRDLSRSVKRGADAVWDLVLPKL